MSHSHPSDGLAWSHDVKLTSECGGAPELTWDENPPWEYSMASNDMVVRDANGDPDLRSRTDSDFTESHELLAAAVDLSEIVLQKTIFVRITW